MRRKQLTVPSRSSGRAIIKRQIIIVADIASLYLQFAVAFVRTVRTHQYKNMRERKKKRERERERNKNSRCNSPRKQLNCAPGNIVAVAMLYFDTVDRSPPASGGTHAGDLVEINPISRGIQKRGSYTNYSNFGINSKAVTARLPTLSLKQISCAHITR